MRLVEVTHGTPLEELLRGLRHEGLSKAEIARRVGVPYGTVHRWLARFGLDNRTLIQKALDTPPAGGGDRP